MAKKNNKRQKPTKPSPKIKQEETEEFNAIDRMMWSNRGVWIERQ